MAGSKQNVPFAIVFAGPNGSGKTSLIDEVRATGLAALGNIFPVPEYFINPDQVARELPGVYATQDERDQAAFDRGIELRRQAIDTHTSFAYETVFSHPSRVNEIVMLKAKGFRVLLTFIATEDPEINVRRVEQRFETKTTTGHFVPPERVRDRYHRIMKLLPTAVEMADAVFIYDNSIDFAPPTQEAIVDGEELSIADQLPGWIERHFFVPLQQRASELEEYRAQCQAADVPLLLPNLLDGEYVGTVERATTHFALQRTTDGDLVLHDRALLDTARESHPAGQHTYAAGTDLRIVYSEAVAPVVLGNGAGSTVDVDAN